MLALLLACSPSSGDSATPSDDTSTVADDTATCVPLDDEPAACATATEGEYFHGCLWDAPIDDLTLTGAFTEFGAGGVTFVAEDGTIYDLSGGTAGVWAELPDLVAAGDVNVRILGDCGDYGGGSATLLVTTLADELLFLAARGAGPWSIGAWSAARVEAGCGERENAPNECSVCVEPQPISVTGPVELEAWAGTPDVSEGYRLSVGISYHGRIYECADGPGDDVAFWYVVRD
jgi:hypothetical protein